MTSVGRGRGWATAPMGKSELRRPGGTVSPQNSLELTSLINEINSIEKDAELDKKCQQLANSFININNIEEITEVSKKLYDYALSNREFTQKYILLIQTESFAQQLRETIQTNLWSLFFKSAQISYQNRNELRKENVEKFRNAVCMLCDVFVQAKSISPALYQIIADAILSYMNMLIETCEEEDIEIVMEKLTLIGAQLQNVFSKDTSLEELIISAKHALITKEFTCMGRAMLLYIIELGNQKFNPLSNNMIEFYSSLLDSRRSKMIRPSSTTSNVPTPRAIHGAGIRKNTVTKPATKQ